MFWIVHIERREQPIGKTSLLERQLTAVFVLLISLYGYSYAIFYIKIQSKLFHGLHANKHLFLATFHLLQVLHQSQIKKTCYLPVFILTQLLQIFKLWKTRLQLLRNSGITKVTTYQNNVGLWFYLPESLNLYSSVDQYKVFGVTYPKVKS